MSVNLQRLSDDEIRHIYKSIANWPGAEGFLKAYATAVCAAKRRDFLSMRAISLLFIAKYNLGSYLSDYSQPTDRRTA